MYVPCCYICVLILAQERAAVFSQLYLYVCSQLYNIQSTLHIYMSSPSSYYTRAVSGRSSKWTCVVRHYLLLHVLLLHTCPAPICVLMLAQERAAVFSQLYLYMHAVNCTIFSQLCILPQERAAIFSQLCGEPVSRGIARVREHSAGYYIFFLFFFP